MKLSVVPLAAVAVQAQHFPGISFVGTQLNRFTSLFASPERHARAVSTGTPLSATLSCPQATYQANLPLITARRRRDDEFVQQSDYSGEGEADYELTSVSTPQMDMEMLGPENTTLGPRKMKRMMKRARKRKPLTPATPVDDNQDGSRGERIVGGQDTTKSVWKWIVHLPDVGCGGTIISNNWVLTAAHCCYGTNPWRYRTVTNDWDVTLSVGDEVEYYPAQIIRHPDYNGTTFSHDFCLLRYTEDLVSTDVEPACLPAADQAPAIRNLTDPVLGNCHVAGWGVTNTTTGVTASFLQEVEVEILNSTDCNTNAYNGTLDDTMFCAGTMEGGFDACQGDSGGPLICEANGEPVLEGVVSWGEGCAKAGKPGVYGAVNSVVDWIHKVAGGQTVNATWGWDSPTATHIGNTADMSVASCGNMDPITGYEGSITLNVNETTEEYANNLQCTWTIRVPVGMIVQVNVTSLDVEYGPSCEYDRLQFVEGTEPIWTGSGPNGAFGRKLSFDDDYYNWFQDEDKVIKDVCGNMTTNNNMILVQSRDSNQMTIIFTSDMNESGAGFNLTYKAVGEESRFDDNCGVSVKDGRNGTLSSPMMEGKKGGDTYPPNSDCQWTIDVGELQTGEVVEVTFEEFELEGGSSKDTTKACPYDYLEIESSDLYGKNEEKDLRRLCGDEHPGILTFTGQKVYFRFFSDQTTQFKGFKLSWNVKSTIIKIYSYRDALAYTVVTRPRTFDEAVIDCDNLGLQLTRLRSDDASKALVDELKAKNIEGDFYIGLQRHAEMNRFWTWIDGQSIHGDGVYSGWLDGHPVADASCGYIDTDFPAKNEKEKGRWRASKCEEQRNYICGKKYTAVEDCPLENLPPNTELRNETCQKNVPGWRGSACGLQCKPGFFMMPVETGAKIPKKIRATCVKPRRLDTYSWIIKSKVSFVCQQDCPYPHGQPNASVKFVERSWFSDNQGKNFTNTALLVIVNFQSKNPVNGWTSRLTFHGGNITDIEFSSYSANLIQKDPITSSVVFSSNDFNANQKGVFAYLLRVVQPAEKDILSDQKNLDEFQYQWDPVEDSMVTTYYIEGQIDQPIDLSCGAPPTKSF